MANIFGTVHFPYRKSTGEAEKATAEMAQAVSSSGSPQVVTDQNGLFSMGTTQGGGVEHKGEELFALKMELFALCTVGKFSTKEMWRIVGEGEKIPESFFSTDFLKVGQNS